MPWNVLSIEKTASSSRQKSCFPQANSLWKTQSPGGLSPSLSSVCRSLPTSDLIGYLSHTKEVTKEKVCLDISLPMLMEIKHTMQWLKGSGKDEDKWQHPQTGQWEQPLSRFSQNANAGFTSSRNMGNEDFFMWHFHTVRYWLLVLYFMCIHIAHVHVCTSMCGGQKSLLAVVPNDIVHSVG